MEVYCTRPHCPRPQNYFPDLDNTATLRTVQQKFCSTCGMPLILAGRYIPTKQLGRGGFGAAFLARDRYTPVMRECVVKQFFPAGNLTPAQLKIALDLFEREATVLEEIGNQNDQIPDLFAYFPVIVEGSSPGQQEQFFYLVQEYIDGLNLEEELAQKGSFSEPEIVEVLREILKVLDFVHHKDIIHRDIKPSNIMRDKNGRLFLLDFGAVKQVTKSANTASTGIYSQGFAPPEQISGGQVFPSSDLYALAVTIITLLTNKDATQLFDGFSNQWQWQNHTNVSPYLAKILNKMLQNAANKRFQSASQILEALKNVGNSQPSSKQAAINPQTTATQINNPVNNPGNNPPSVPKQRASVQQFSTIEMLVGAGFSGFQGGLIAIALISLVKSPIVALLISGAILTILIYAQTRRWLERFDLLIIPTITFAIIYFVPLLQANLGIQTVIILSGAAGLVAIALTSLFWVIGDFLIS
ncbi:serine/threonine-protein kinase [Brunnivagina elsteri]|uniref:non-specific serine/threonine protein kinase n=1 Tax=Brunnivagina elsteri CCALA 953 TaxID=987040 RepID=A0A2A2TJR8_9CYAN|nr:serine/threonine-protein kinase [Calothrix elsteri]PAX55854.1 serine/threonine protein kinase [Calothrix elsteri CCALA 953]